MFTPCEEEKQRLAHRLAQLSQQLTEPAPPLPVIEVPEMRCECNQSDEEFGTVVRGLQKPFVPVRFSVWCLPAVFHCPARHHLLPIMF